MQGAYSGAYCCLAWLGPGQLLLKLHLEQQLTSCLVSQAAAIVMAAHSQRLFHIQLICTAWFFDRYLSCFSSEVPGAVEVGTQAVPGNP